jgi:hypothetical protein
MPALVVPPTQAAKASSTAHANTPYDPHLPAGQSSEADLHKDILNQKASGEHPSGDKGQGRI